MILILSHLLKWAVALSLFYVCYMLLLRRDTFHGLKRASLLFILVASFLLPFLHLEITRGPDASDPSVLTALIERYNTTIERLPDVEPEAGSVLGGFPAESAPNSDAELEAIRQQARQHNKTVQRQWTIVGVLFSIYAWGVLLLLAAYVYSLLAAAWLIVRSRRVQPDDAPSGIRVLANAKLDTPCSWMRWVLVPDSLLTNTDALRMTLLHEQAHVRLGHSLDRILAELTARILWPLPFAWMLRRELVDVHEYEADRAVLWAGVSQQAYDKLLVAEVTRARIRPVVNAFDQTQVKKRLTMMYAKASSRLSRTKTLFVLPLIAVMLVLLGCVKSKAETPKSLTPEEQAQEFKDFLTKEGFDILYSPEEQAQVKKEVADRVTAIYDEVFDWYRNHPEALSTPDFDTDRFLSKDYMRTLRAVRKKDASLEGEVGFYDYDHWLMAQDWSADLSYNLDSVQASYAGYAAAWLTIHDGENSRAVWLEMRPENGEWRIDDFMSLSVKKFDESLKDNFSSEKFQMKLYLGEDGRKMMNEKERFMYEIYCEREALYEHEQRQKEQEEIDKLILERLQGTWDYVPTDHEVASHYIIEGDQLTYPKRCDPVEWNTYTLTIVANTIYLRDNASDYKMKLTFYLRGDTLYTTEIGTDLSGHDRKERESFVSVRRKE